MHAKTHYKEGDRIYMSSPGTPKEEGIVIDKKEKTRGNIKLSPLYKIKTVSGSMRWVSETALSTAYSTQHCIENGANSIPWPFFPISPTLKEILKKEKATMRAYIRPPKYKMSAEMIFEQFHRETKEKKTYGPEEEKEVICGLKELFLYTLHTFCLYKEEHSYYKTKAYPEGPEHILQTYGLPQIIRFIVSLYRLEEKVELSVDFAGYLIEYLKLFVDFIERNHTSMHQHECYQY